MLPQSSRLSVGDIVQFGAVRFVVIGAASNAAVVCEIIGPTSVRHRADVSLSWSETLLIGVRTRSAVRCVPRLFRVSQRLRKIGAAENSLATRIRKKAVAEIETQRAEDAWLFAQRLCG